MIPEFGHFALILALATAVMLSVIPQLGVLRQNALAITVARPLALIQFLFIAISYLCLTYAFISNDFSVWYTASNSNSTLPLVYRITAVWGAHEGSLLLWVLILAGWTGAVALFSRHLPQTMLALVLSVLGIITTCFLLFILFTSNPFGRLLPFPPLDGLDLNPLLQDPGLIIHPPILYMGYVGFSVTFAFALAALIRGEFDKTWARWSRPWALVAWVFLTIGIALGSWWAYYELGWGGWWFWDPVENASFMPWLVGTALIHSLSASDVRGVFKNWTLLLAICTFSLSLLGTFIVRSGVLTSVHAFANDPERGLFLLLFLALVIGGSLVLYLWRASNIKSEVKFFWLSRETLLLTNNIILVVACGTVLLGTLYPLFLDALNLGKISVGPPYFNAMFIPLTAILAIVMALGPMSRWKAMSPSWLLQRLQYTAIFSVVVGVLLPWIITGELKGQVALGIIIAVWIIVVTFNSALARSRYKIKGFSKFPRAYYGMIIAHIGLAITIIGVTLVSAYDVERDIRMSVGDTVSIGAYQFTLNQLQNLQGPNYTGVVGSVNVTKHDKAVTILYPEKRIYTVTQMPMSQTAISPGLFRDLYIALGDPLNENTWSVRVYYKPFVRWLWLGAIFMAVGGLLAALDKRYRLLASKERSQWNFDHAPHSIGVSEKT